MARKTKHRTYGEVKALIPQLIKDGNKEAVQLAKNLADVLEYAFELKEQNRWRPMSEFDMTEEVRRVELCEILEQDEEGYTHYKMLFANWSKHTDFLGRPAGFAWFAHGRLLTDFTPHYWRKAHIPSPEQIKVISDKLKEARLEKESKSFWRKK